MAAVLAVAALAGAVWLIRTGAREKSRRVGLFVLGMVMVLVSVGLAGASSAAFDARHAEEVAAARRVADAAAQKAAAQRAEEARLAAEAKAMGISVADYNKATDALLDARTDCANYLAAHAKYQVKLSDTSQAGWASNGTVIMLQGHDVMLQNGFGAWTHPEYRCTWNIAMHKVLDFKVKNSG